MSTIPRLLGGRYEVGELIGRGGMAEVHLGHDTRLGRTVAIKMLRSDLARDPAFLARFRREAHSVAGLSHATIVAVYDSGEDHLTETGGADSSVPYIVMEHIEGRTLREILDERGRFSADEASRVTDGVLAALEYSHDKGIVHRDIKPANVMLTPRGEVKVMDFGIARAMADTAATMTQTQAVIGTAQYLSPEQAQGRQVDARSDLYSAGCLLFELLTGRTPFVGDSPVSVAYQHVGEEPQPPSVHGDGLSPELDAIVLHALVKDREARYQHASQFRADLRAAREGRPISSAARATAAEAGAWLGASTDPTVQLSAVDATAGPVAAGRAIGDTASLQPATGTAPDPPEPPRRRRRALLIVLAVVVVAVLAGLALASSPLFSGSPAPTKAVPPVVNMTQQQALNTLDAQGFVGKVVPGANGAETGTVFAQNPPAGQQRPPDSTVVIRVSTGPGEISVPDVGNFTEASARKALEGVGLSVGSVVPVDDSQVDKGHVIDTDPAIGTKVAPGATVDLKVSSGKVTVPDVVGDDLVQARNTLHDLGLRTRTTFKESDQAKGTVLQESDSGSVVDRGAEITLVVAKPQPAPTPSDTPTPSPTPTGTPSPTPTGTPSPTPTGTPSPTPTGTPSPTPSGTPTPTSPSPSSSSSSPTSSSPPSSTSPTTHVKSSAHGKSSPPGKSSAHGENPPPGKK